jgi:hypothetical protein
MRNNWLAVSGYNRCPRVKVGVAGHALDIRLGTKQPISKLPIVANLTAANKAAAVIVVGRQIDGRTAGGQAHNIWVAASAPSGIFKDPDRHDVDVVLGETMGAGV